MEFSLIKVERSFKRECGVRWAPYVLFDPKFSFSYGVPGYVVFPMFILLDQRIKLLFKWYAFSNGFLEALFGGRSLDCGAMMNEVEGER